MSKNNEEIKRFEDWFIADSKNGAKGYGNGKFSYSAVKVITEEYLDYVLDHPSNNPNPDKELNSPTTIVKERFEKVAKTINEEFGDGYATKNPDLVKFLMVEISQEIQTQNQNGHN